MNRLLRFKKMSILLLLTGFLLSGPAFAQRLRDVLVQGARIGVVADFPKAALFQRVGTTSIDNASFHRRVPGLSMNALVTTVVAKDLYHRHHFTVIPIYHRAVSDFLAGRVVRHHTVRLQYQHFLAPLIQNKRLNLLVLIVPGTIDFGEGQYYGSIWRASGYGLFNRSFMFMDTNTVFSAYKVYVIDVRNYRVLARARGDFRTRLHEIKIKWRKGYVGVSTAALDAIRSELRSRMPATLTRVVHKTGLP